MTTTQRTALVIRWASYLAILVGLIVIVRTLPVGRGVLALRGWVDGLGFLGMAVFALAYILAALLFIPGSALTLAAGAVFGLTFGTAVVSVASTTAAALAFLIARYLARDKMEHLARRHRKFGAMDRAIGEGGWRIVALLRLSPAVPYSAGNYLYGLTAIRFWPYVLASWLAMLPGTFLYVYLGYAGTAGLRATEGSSRGPGEWTLLAVGLLATIAVTIYITKLARRALREQAQLEEKDEPMDAETTARQTSRWRTIVPAVCALLVLAGAGQAHFHRGFLKSLFGPPQVTLAESYEAKPGGPTFDHSDFDALLKKHVDAEGQFDYRELKKDPKPLDAYIASLEGAPLDELGRDERLALLINAYNAFTLRLILNHYPLASIKDIPSDQRWDAVRWKVGGHEWSLNQIEHERIRPHFREPRIHFALVCAAKGCPPLRKEAYVAKRLEEQLEAQARYVHQHERWFRFPDSKDSKEGGQTVHLTELYDWYRGDFEQVAGSVLDYAARYAPELKSALEAGRTPEIEWIDYDWSLNEQEQRDE